MADIRDFRNKNTVFTGTDSIIVPSGTTAERSGTELGQLRYNTDLGFLEQYNATGWAGIDAPPSVTNQTGTINEDTDSTITITGSNFKSASTVSVEGDGVSGISRTLATTFVSSTELTAATNASAVNYVGGQSYSIKVTNPSGLSAVLEPAGTVDRDPVWSTGAGTIATVVNSARTGFSVSVTANDPDGGSVTYSQVSGSLPGGTTFSGNTISGNVSAVGSDTTYTFTIRATSNGQSEDRTFNIIVQAPVANTFNYTGSTQTFTAPATATFQVYVWGAGGGTGGSQNQTFGGAGGFAEGLLSASSGQTYRVQVGGGGNHTSSGTAGGGFAGGGNAGNVPGGNQGGASGGGYSGVFLQNVSFSNARILAGGGGGGAGNGSSGAYNGQNSQQSGYGGSGGGANGQSAVGNYASGNSGFGGSQNAGGGRNANTNNGAGNPSPGGQLQGGTGGQFISSQNHSSGGGGGGGYYGGGGGRGGEGGITAGDSGGGGSGYIGGVSSASYSNGQGAGQFNTTGNTTRPSPPETGNTYYPGNNVGTGGPYRGSGGNGAVVIIT